MITRGTAIWSRVRRCFSPTEWFVRWFGLPKSVHPAAHHGLVLIQIDGLSRRQLERAIADGRMPFLRTLLDQEHYEVHDLYSGLPSSTPAVQGELFYGVKCAVPAFGYRDHRSGQIVRLYSRETAADVEAHLADQEVGVLNGGSAYCNIYGGAAEETHFCASSMGVSEIMQSVRAWRFIPFLLWHAWSMVRVTGLLGIESVLAFGGFVKGALTGKQFWQELLMIPARVVVVILMRELATIGATMDVTRGVPVVQLNFLGYDEQAHRRGPKSAFAHWTLKGIDSALKRIWRAAHRAHPREYDVWIYSDHGQVTSIPFEDVTGKEISKAASEVVAAVCGTDRSPISAPRIDDSSRAGWLSAGWLVGKLFGEHRRDLHGGTGGVQVAALGPIGHIYANRTITDEQRLEIARRLVHDHGVPLAFAKQGETAIGFCPDGEFDLRQQPKSIYGDHPFLWDVVDDTVRLAHHPDAGDVVVSGWVRGGESLSFAVQNGAHAGPSPEETGAFVMAPSDVHLNDQRRYLRPNDLRLAVRRFLHPSPSKLLTEPWYESYEHVRVMTYNVHACVGLDHQLDARRIARVIAQSQADIVALQELDVGRARSGFCDQAQEIARLLEMECHFHPAWRLLEESYGDAILSRYPMSLVRSGQLPQRGARREPRGAIWVQIEPHTGANLQVINTHLSLYPRERNRQAAALVSDWVRAATERGSVIVCGDFNAPPNSPAYRCLGEQVRDVQTYNVTGRPAPTYFSPKPLARIDHIFVSENIAVKDTRVMNSRLARTASDHLPLIADLVVPYRNVDVESSSASVQRV